MGKVLNHLGVYGINMIDEKLLCIKKNRGPYFGRYDLPGGSQKINESIVETLIREVKEETNLDIINYKQLFTLDCFIHPNTSEDIIHHIAIVYTMITKNSDTKKISSFVNNEINDSIGIEWVDINKLNITNASPIILEAIKYLENNSQEKRIDYYNWKVLAGKL